MPGWFVKIEVLFLFQKLNFLNNRAWEEKRWMGEEKGKISFHLKIILLFPSRYYSIRDNLGFCLLLSH